MRYSVLSSKRQLTLSKTDLEHLGIDPRGRVTIDYEKDSLVIRARTLSVVEEIEGSLRNELPESKYAKSFEDLVSDTKRKIPRR